MRRLVALLLVLMLAVSFMTVSVAANDFDMPDPNQGNGDNGGNNNDNGGSSGPVVGTGDKKDFTEPPAVEGTTAPVEETTEPIEETVPTTEATTAPTEEATEPTEESTVPSETTVAETEPAATSQPDPNTVLGVSQQIVGNSTGQIVEEAPETDSGSETYLLVALIAGLGAICAVLVIRRVLDV